MPSEQKTKQRKKVWVFFFPFSDVRELSFHAERKELLEMNMQKGGARDELTGSEAPRGGLGWDRGQMLGSGLHNSPTKSKDDNKSVLTTLHHTCLGGPYYLISPAKHYSCV